MKKKIVFMVINMNIGGTEKALLNMISEIPKDKYEITIFMLEKYGGFFDSIPNEVKVEYFKDYHLIKEQLNSPPLTMSIRLLKEGKVKEGTKILYFHLVSKITKNRIQLYKHLLKNAPILKQEYDIAVAYAGPMDFISYFVVHKIKAKKKVQWIHFDVTKIGFNKRFVSKLYNKFDKIFVVSEEARTKFVKEVPALTEKTDVFFNMVSPKMIDSQSKEFNGFNDDFEGLRILTVGRLTKEKGQDLAIDAMNKLVQDGINVRWYCIGEGKSRSEYEELVEKFNLQDHFIFLGSTSNPYPYIENCDIYVQPSRYEGYCITLIEARCLKKPIVTTDVNGAREQIKNEENGLIVDINSNEIYRAVKKLIADKELRMKFATNLAKEVFMSNNELKKIYNISK